jgi:addiction module HigA family antidote
MSLLIHPGEILREEFVVPLKLSAGKIAKACGIPRTRIERILREEIGISADTALRLARLFNTSTEIWLNLQKYYEIEMAKKTIKKELENIQPIMG